MTRAFLDKENFLLKNDTALKLYDTCKNEPIYDYHCHLNPKEIAENINQKDLSSAWLGSGFCGDHYKWRMMRAMGVEEKLITGNAAPYDKFLAWAKTAENLIGNPLYHWTHLELQRYFDIYEPLTEESAPAIWEKANSLLKTKELSVKGIFEEFNIHTVGTTDDPVDSLEYHKAIACGSAPIGKIKTKVIPTFRPDRALDLHDEDYINYIDTLSHASGIKITNYIEFLAALEKRLDYFIENGCLSSDHSLSSIHPVALSFDEIQNSFKKVLQGKNVSIQEADSFRIMTLIYLSSLYAKKNTVMQIHCGVLRNINTAAFRKLGANTGFDAVNDSKLSENMSYFLNAVNSSGEYGVPKTILYSLNPKDYYPLAAIIGGFQGNCTIKEHSPIKSVKGKMQLGAAWWFCDNKDGIEEQMRVLANLGVLPLFIGMLTDSRSFLSYPRHEYFRRILCNLIGEWVENGEYPNNFKQLEKIVKNISFNNALNYFGK